MKSKVQWLKEGDNNMKFFHAKTVTRQGRNKIRGLEDEVREWHEDEKKIQGITVKYFEQLFTSSSPLQFDEIINCVDHRVSEQHNCELTQEVMEVEIQEVIFQIPPTNASRPNGLTGGFYHNYCDIMGDDVVEAVLAFF
ncbi:hypothetical protein CerSpe_169980 [Prunus speciosa]